MTKSLIAVTMMVYAVGCNTANSRRVEAMQGAISWQAAMKTANAKAKQNDFDYIIDHLLAPASRETMKERYGSGWRNVYRDRKLSSLRYYLGWLKKSKPNITADQVRLESDNGCYAIFVKVFDSWYLGDFGQKLSSM